MEKKIFHVKNHQQRAGVPTLISERIYFKSKTVTRDKERQCMLIKASIYQENLTIISIHAPNIRSPKYIKQTLTELKREMDSSTIIETSIPPLSIMDKTTR